MSALSTLKALGGCIGGKELYKAAKIATYAANINRKRRRLWKNTKKLMKTYFPKLNLNKVRFSIHSRLPGNIFRRNGKYKAITFGNRIFFNKTDYQKSRKGLKLLMHELVHVNQVRRLGGQKQFACAYGIGYLNGGSYEKNPMEIEATDFVKKHGGSLPDGVKK